MKENIKEIIKELSEQYDKDSQDTFISLYLNKKDYKKFLDKRIRICKSILTGDNLINFDKTINKIESTFNNFTSISIAIFGSNKNEYLKFIKLSVELKNTLIVDSSPYIRPLARIQDEWESFTLVLINSNYAKIFSVSIGEIDDIKKMKTDIINKHKKGGWSQARFNRLRRGAIDKFLSEVAKALQKKTDENILISGPGMIKNRFIEMLSKDLKKRIIDVIDIDIDDEQKLLKKSFRLVSEKEEAKSSEAVNQLKQEILKDGLAVYGLNETLEAVKNGQVDILIIEKNYKKHGWVCEHCQVVEEGNKKTCPYCENKTSEVDIIEEILEFAERTNANIEFTDSDEIADLGHIGGILRFK